MIGVAALAAMTSCDSPTYPGGEGTDEKNEGEGSVSFANMSISVKNSEIIINSRAGSEDVSKYTVSIKRVDGTSAASAEGNQSFIYGNMPELIALPVGDYVVEAYNAEEQVAAFDAPYFQGESNQFTVKANDIVTVDPIVCTLKNVKVSIDYTDELRAHMSDVTVTVKVAESETLDFAGDETRSGYFKYVEGNTTIAATFNGKVDGFEVSDYRVLTNAVAPGYHHTITFSLKDTPTPPDEHGSIGDTGISLDATVARVDVNGDIDPGDEELIEPDAPKEYLTVGTTALNFGCDASQSNVQVKSSDAWTAESSAPWCTVTKTETGMTVAVAANSDANNDRTATITVTMGKLTATIAVTQAKYTEAPQGPTFESENIDLWSGAYNDPANFNASHPASVVISVPKGIKILHVSITAPAEGGSILPDIVPDAGLETAFDLATGLGDSGNDLTDALCRLGFPVASGGSYVDDITGETVNYGAVLNETSVVFDITSFMDLIPAAGKGKTDFVVDVTDIDGNTGQAIIRYEVK